MNKKHEIQRIFLKSIPCRGSIILHQLSFNGYIFLKIFIFIQWYRTIEFNFEWEGHDHCISKFFFNLGVCTITCKCFLDPIRNRFLKKEYIYSKYPSPFTNLLSQMTLKFFRDLFTQKQMPPMIHLALIEPYLCACATFMRPLIFLSGTSVFPDSSEEPLNIFEFN